MKVCLKNVGENDLGEENDSGETRDIGAWEKSEIEPVVIRKVEYGEEAGDSLDTKKENNGEREDFIIGKLRRKILSYYDLEEAYVEIQVMEG